MAYKYKTQANVNLSEIDSPDVNLDFKTVDLPEHIVEKCFRCTPKARKTTDRAQRTTLKDSCLIVGLYLSGLTVKEVARVSKKSVCVSHRILRSVFGSPLIGKASKGHWGKMMNKENRLRNLMNRDLLSVEECFEDD